MSDFNMREILFRGKRIDNGKWVEGLLVKDTEFYGEPDNHVYIVNHKHPSGCFGGDIYYEVDPETVGQYTGLLDSNGKKIFEGDILRYRERTISGKDVYKCASVEFAEGGFVASNHFLCDWLWEGEYGNIELRDVVIIGNIHDNPELLEGAE